jgi:hypothetical protein
LAEIQRVWTDRLLASMLGKSPYRLAPKWHCIEAEGERAMMKRLRPACLLACALLLLAATSLFATEVPDQVSSRVEKAQGQQQRAQIYQRPPASDPTPGDDDIPQRNGVPLPRGPSNNRAQENGEWGGIEGRRLHDLGAGLRWYLMLVLRNVR